MPEIRVDLGDAAQLADMLTFLAQWLSGSQKQALAGSLAAFVGHPACNTVSEPSASRSAITWSVSGWRA